MTAALVFAAYLLIGQLADIGFRTIVDQLREADPAWLIVALMLAQATFIGNGISVRGAVAEPLPLFPCVVLQSAMKFINLTVPSSAGRIGLNIRFLQRIGVPTPHAVAAGAADDASETMVQIALFLLAIPFVRVEVDTGQFGGGGPDARLLVAIGVVLLVSAVLVWKVPNLRKKVLPPIRSALSSPGPSSGIGVSDLSSSEERSSRRCSTCLRWSDMPRIRDQSESRSTHLHQHVGGCPLEPGSGTRRDREAAKASLAAAMIAMGVDESAAFTIAITQRLWTFYLPPIWRYASLRWLARKGYV